MSDVGERDRAREMARALTQQLARAVERNSRGITLDAVRDQARALGLPGLDHLLVVLARYVGGPWPAPLVPVIERLERVAAECARECQLDGFRGMDDELDLMARAIERVPLGSSAPPRPERRTSATHQSAPVALVEALEGVPGERGLSDTLRRVRLYASVAGALRAALEWLVGGNSARTRMWLTTDGSALDVTCEGISFTGLHPAAEVLAGVGASLGPTGARPGAWTVRVPIHTERETFLMLEQDELQLAIPWHAVVRVRMVPIQAIDIMLHRQGLPILKSLVASARRGAEQPVTVVALGLKRACLVADRLVWRMSAEPAEPPGTPPAEGIRRAVRTDDDEVHWVLEPEWLLRDVAAPPLARPGFRPAAPPAPPPSDAPPAADPGTRSGGDTPPLPALAPEHVEALDDAPATPADGSGAPVPAEPSAAVPEPPDPGPTDVPARGRVLVAEDSIAARIYLVRLLEQQGYQVHAVSNAAELRASFPEGPWTLVCADEELPDAPGEDLLRELTRDAGGPPVVALVRDDGEARAAHTAGAAGVLRKPYGREALTALLARLLPDGPRPAETGGGPGDDTGGADPRQSGAR